MWQAAAGASSRAAPPRPPARNRCRQVLWETNSKKDTDSKCIVAWSRSARSVLVAYRGTASLANVLSDLKASSASAAHLKMSKVESLSKIESLARA